MGDNDLRMPVRLDHHVLARRIGDETAGVDPFGVGNGAAIRPMAADHVAAVDRPGKTTRHAVAGNSDVDTVAEDFGDARIFDVDGHRHAFHIVDDGAPAGRSMGVGQALNNLHGVERRYFGSANGLRKQHRVDAGFTQRVDNVVGHVTDALRFVRPLFDQRQERVDPSVKFGGRRVRSFLRAHQA